MVELKSFDALVVSTLLTPPSLVLNRTTLLSPSILSNSFPVIVSSFSVFRRNMKLLGVMLAKRRTNKAVLSILQISFFAINLDPKRYGVTTLLALSHAQV